MLTSFFGKSSPINYILLSITIIIGYLTTILFSNLEVFSLVSLLNHASIILLMVFAVLLFDFIIRKNNATGNNTFAILLFTLFVLLVPQVYLSLKIVLANVFLLLATRRILSLVTGKNISKKIFDATMYITLASFCNGWAILFILVLYTGILKKTAVTIRNLIIPVISFSGILVLAITYQLITTDSFEWLYNWFLNPSLDFNKYNLIELLIPTSILLTLLIWMGVTRLFTLKSLSKKEKPAAISFLIIAVVMVFIIIMSPQKNGSELFFLFAPIATITTSYIENSATKEKYIFNEILLWTLVVLPFILPLL